MLPPEIVWKLTYCNGHFSAFWTIFRQILFMFLAPNFECFTKYDAVSITLHSFDYACGDSGILLRRGSKLRKNFILSKHCWKWLVGGMHPVHPPPLDPPREADISSRKREVCTLKSAFRIPNCKTGALESHLFRQTKPLNKKLHIRKVWYLHIPDMYHFS